MDKGLVHVYCGDGKGKTTCAAGLAVRCAGCGGKVIWFQYLKRDISGERKSLEKLENITLIPGYDKIKFTFKMTEEEKSEARAFYVRALENIKKMTEKEDYDMVVLDEVMAGISTGLVDESAVTEFIDNRPKGLEVVLTGRDPSENILKRADYISEIKKIKHPFDMGQSAREKIEY